ncbi:hypothetical protein GCM10009805_28260 [Leucobacter chromiireducens subsp. solipictus]
MHFGQVSQPRPDPVNRTAPPVATISTCVANTHQARAFTREVTRSGIHLDRRLARAVSGVVALDNGTPLRGLPGDPSALRAPLPQTRGNL